MNNNHKPMFTPGPWVTSTQHFHTAVNSTDKHVAMVSAPTIDITQSEHDANARLIAAAPDLYRVLESIVNAKTTDDVYAQFGNAREALAKARGES